MLLFISLKLSLKKFVSNSYSFNITRLLSKSKLFKGSFGFVILLTTFKIIDFILKASGAFCKSSKNAIGKIIFGLNFQCLSIFADTLELLYPVNFSSPAITLLLFISLINCSANLCSLIAFEIIGFEIFFKNAGIKSELFKLLSNFDNHLFIK